MIRTPLSTVIGGAFWTPSSTVIGGQQSFSQLIKKLFANGEQGFFYDPNDLITMFQDAAGTIPVTGAWQPVGLILDKSGRNNHAYQTVSASRPILQRNATTGAYYLAFDGSDDFLVTGNIDFTATDKVSLFTGVYKAVDSIKIITEFSASVNSNAGSFQLITVSNPENGYASLSRGTASASSVAKAISSTYPAPDGAVLSAKHNISTDLSSISRNGVVSTDGSKDQGSGNFGNYPLYIGKRGGTSLAFYGHIYSLIGVGKLTTDSETAAIEKELAKRTGVTLNV